MAICTTIIQNASEEEEQDNGMKKGRSKEDEDTVDLTVENDI